MFLNEATGKNAVARRAILCLFLFVVRNNLIDRKQNDKKSSIIPEMQCDTK